MTVQDLVEQMCARLDRAGVSYGHGTTCSFDEAAWLVLWRLGRPLGGLADVAGLAVAPTDAVLGRFTAKSHTDLRGLNHCIIPGFVNAHTHSPMTLLRGFVDNVALMDW